MSLCLSRSPKSCLMLDPFLTFAPLEHLWTHIFHAPPVVSHVSVRSLACSIPCFNQQLSSDPDSTSLSPTQIIPLFSLLASFYPPVLLSSASLPLSADLLSVWSRGRKSSCMFTIFRDMCAPHQSTCTRVNIAGLVH